jgi:hypothetical protein
MTHSFKQWLFNVLSLSTGQKLYHLQKLLEGAIQVEHDRAEMVKSIAKKAFGSATMRFD